VAVELSASVTHHEDGISGKTSTPASLSLGKEPSLPTEQVAVSLNAWRRGKTKIPCPCQESVHNSSIIPPDKTMVARKNYTFTITISFMKNVSGRRSGRLQLVEQKD